MQPVAEIREDDLNHALQTPVMRGMLAVHRQQIEADLKAAGADAYDLMLPETHSLPLVIQPDERIIGIVYGHYGMEQGQVQLTGRGALIATDKRVMLLDKKPFFVKFDQIVYRSINGISFSRAGLASTIVVHARVAEIHTRTCNQACAQRFVNAIESHIFDDRSSPAA